MTELIEDNFIENWDLFLAPYEQAVEELKLKLKNIRKQIPNFTSPYADRVRHRTREDTREYSREDGNARN